MSEIKLENLSKTKNLPQNRGKFLARGGEQGVRSPSTVKWTRRVSGEGAALALYSPVTAAWLLYQKVNIKQKHLHDL